VNLLHRLAHRLLGWEYVTIGEMNAVRRACYSLHTGRWIVFDEYGGTIRLNEDGSTAASWHDRPVTWHPLTPGVARFYKGEE